MDPATHLLSIESPQSTIDIAQMTKVPYQEAVGTLIYAMLDTQLDITYTVQFLSKFSKNPGKSYWKAVKRVFQYLKETCCKGTPPFLPLNGMTTLRSYLSLFN